MNKGDHFCVRCGHRSPTETVVADEIRALHFPDAAAHRRTIWQAIAAATVVAAVLFAFLSIHLSAAHLVRLGQFLVAAYAKLGKVAFAAPIAAMSGGAVLFVVMAGAYVREQIVRIKQRPG